MELRKNQKRKNDLRMKEKRTKWTGKERENKKRK